MIVLKLTTGCTMKNKTSHGMDATRRTGWFSLVYVILTDRFNSFLICIFLEVSTSLPFTIHIVSIGKNRPPLLIEGALLKSIVCYGSKSVKRLQAKTSTCAGTGKEGVELSCIAKTSILHFTRM